MNNRLGAVAAIVAAMSCGCAIMPPKVVRDGELQIPADYKSWPKYLSAVQRPDAKQVREIYMNPVSRSATAASGFPNGTLFVMENYAAKARADGSLETGADGKLVKGDLLRVFVMGKNAGWGVTDVAEPLRNGNWVYAAWLPGGQKAPDDTNTCRACHLPMANKDFVHRYDEYFASRP
ncbi:MAG TPA: cytochrome P460 family protein [Burkholderiaceae bacterium]|nr:cytochrome P460 family protein [Burkholderiaceae bacterium]